MEIEAEGFLTKLDDEVNIFPSLPELATCEDGALPGYRIRTGRLMTSFRSTSTDSTSDEPRCGSGPMMLETVSHADSKAPASQVWRRERCSPAKYMLPSGLRAASK